MMILKKIYNILGRVTSQVKTYQYSISAILVFVPICALAAPPIVRTPSPVTYLADNLDEKDGLGYCIDTVGRGFGVRLHAHSCKPRGGDVQFYYDKLTRQIVSATFSGKCASLMSLAAIDMKLGLVDCSVSSLLQLFHYDTIKREFQPLGDRSFCLAVGGKSKRAGPFMSRELKLAKCDSTDNKYKQWQMKN